MASAESTGEISRLKDLKSKTCLMLIGAPGAGKSSLINSLINLCRSKDDGSPKKRIRYIPTAKSHYQGGHTMMREPVDLTPELTVFDNRGCADWENEAALEELVAQIRGERSLLEDVNWIEKQEESTKRLVISPRIDCVSIVLNGKGGIEVSGGLKNVIEACRKNLVRKPSVVVTHKDLLSHEEIDSLEEELEKEGIEQIFFIKNITEKNENLDEDAKSVLKIFIECCMDDGDVGADFHKLRDDKKKKEEEIRIEERAEALSDFKFQVEVRKVADSMMKLDIDRALEENRKTTEQKRIERKLAHEDRLNEIEQKKRVEMKNKHLEDADAHSEIYRRYLSDLYERRLRNANNS